MRSGVGFLIGALTSREQLILRLRYGLGGEEEHTLEQIGQSLGLSRERVRQLEARALKKLRETLPAQNLPPDPRALASVADRVSLIACLDLEGVLVPEIWINVAGAHGHRRRCAVTTRDEPDYDVLMKKRLAILEQHGLGLPGHPGRDRGPRPARRRGAFLDRLRERFRS
jgi:DNA-binding CsgD family transcriptional regulator